ncbi:MAG: hypothetical protein IJ560_01705 [Alphaproteobacteria bacterium]|nr:hypothetical protein [Alphaproteobacteria bacterium]
MRKPVIDMNKIFSGGFFANSRTRIMSAIGIISAIAAYMVGDSDLFAMCGALFTIGGIYFMQQTNETKGK